jgi:GntR family transcriptional regulator, transcriptional repressor for pyruvate dehydrogenase complex
LNARDLVLGPLAPTSAVEQIVRRLGEAIGSGVLAPGERLPAEAELAAQLGVATMTLRQALGVLRDAGVVETRRGRSGGTFVRADPPALGEAGEPPSARELRELTDWRRAVSGEAAALAAGRAGASAGPQLRALAAAVEAAVGEFAAFRLADARFHLAVAEASGSSRLVAAEASLQSEVAELLRLVPGPATARCASQTGHEPIVTAIERGDGAAARAAMERHAEATHDWFVGLRLGRLRPPP